MTAWERLLGEPTLRPLGSPCRICGNDPEQRHRVWDALTDRWQAGESLVEVAADYEVTPDDVAAVMVAQGEWLTAEARWWAERLLTARPERVDLKTDRVDLWISGLLADETDTGWDLVGPVQVACGTDSDGGWNVTFAATLTKSESESVSERDILDQDPMLDDTARESIWDRPE